MKENKYNVVGARVTTQEKETLLSLCEKQDKTLSSLIRELLNESMAHRKQVSSNSKTTLNIDNRTIIV